MLFTKKSKVKEKHFNPEKPIQDYYYQEMNGYVFAAIEKINGISFTLSKVFNKCSKIKVDLSYNFKGYDGTKSK